MSSSNKTADQLSHDLKPVLLGLRATLLALEKARVDDARELIEEIEKRVMKLLDELKNY